MWSHMHCGFTVHQFPALQDNYIYLIDRPNDDVLIAVDPAVSKPVITFCTRHNRKLSHILNTHHHRDHVGGNRELKARYGCSIIGPIYDAERIPGIDIMASEEGLIRIGGLQIRILFVPGHTRGHIAGLVEDALFCGDTLFGAGCGRLFEGSPEQMWNSLNKIVKLPENTRFYCAHEYTINNLKFSLMIDPDNRNLQKRMVKSTMLQQQGKPTIPGTLAEELATNPFLRPLDAKFRRWYATKHGLPNDPVRIFAHIRAARDIW